MNALQLEMHLRSIELSQIPYTLYFGGGTPSFLSPEAFVAICQSLQHHYDLKNIHEFTLECNPEDATTLQLNLWQKSGVTRLSMGVQSFNPRWLKQMQRNHDAASVYKALTAIKKVGFSEFSLDLMYGYDGQSLEDLIADLDGALKTQAPHISIYQLTVEEGTPLAHSLSKGRFHTPDTVLESEMYHLISETLRNAGYRHYEISNFALPGHESIHNSNYWNGATYQGLGPSAHSFNGSVRTANVSNLKLWADGLLNGFPAVEQETLSHRDLHNETILLGLRMDIGLDMMRFGKLFGPQAKTRIDNLCQSMPSHWFHSLQPRLALSYHGFAMADSITSRLFLD